VAYVVQANALHDDGPGAFTSDASSLGLKPGQWPQEIVVPDNTNSIRFFRLSPSFNADRDVTAMHYRSERGLRLTVFNDNG